MIRTWFPKQSCDQLKRIAEVDALDVDTAYDRIGASCNVPTDRLIVNYLRHKCTDYDEDQSSDRHREACEAIAERYPQLADECRRQIERRRETDAKAEAMAVCYEIEKQMERDKRHAREEESKGRITTLSVGQKVSYQDRRYTFEAIITKLGRSRVTIAYQVKADKDRDRTKTVHAALIAPPLEANGC